MNRRAAAALALLLAVGGAGACSAFSGASSGDSMDGGAGAEGGNDAGTDGADAEGGPACPIVYSTSFDGDGSAPTGWNELGGGVTAVDKTKPLSGEYSIHSAAPYDDAGSAFTYLSYSMNLAATPSKITAAFSVYLQAWGSGAGVEPGCTLEPNQNDNDASESTDLYRDPNGSLSAYLSGASGYAPLYANLPSEGWYDVTIAATGFADNIVQTVFTIQKHGGGSVVTSKQITALFPGNVTGPTTGVRLNCGLYSVVFDPGGDPIETWVDDVSIGICP